MVKSYPKRLETLWEKEKLPITSNFSFSHSVFKRLVLQTCKKSGLVWEKVKQNRYILVSFYNVGPGWLKLIGLVNWELLVNPFPNDKFYICPN